MSGTKINNSKISFQMIEDEAKRRQDRSDSFMDYAKERAKKKKDEERKLNDKQAIKDMALIYGAIGEDDPKLKEITDMLYEVGNMDVNASYKVWTEGKIYRDVANKARKNLDEILKEAEELVTISSLTLKDENGNWLSEDEINADPELKKVNDNLKIKMDEIEEKERIYNDIIISMETQMDGRLVLNENKLAENRITDTEEGKKKDYYYIDYSNKKFDRVDHEQNLVVQAGMKLFSGNQSGHDYPIFPHEPNGNDVRQGMVGDCYFIASLSNLARLDPDFLKESIRENDDGKTVTVRLFSKDFSGNYKPVYVKVEKIVPSMLGVLTQGGENALWVNCFERALAISGLWAYCDNVDNQAFLPVPDDIDARYERLKDMESKGLLKNKDTLKEEVAKSPWLFRTGKLIKHPSYDAITGGFGGPAMEILAGGKYKDFAVKVPTDSVGQFTRANDTPIYTSEELKFYKLIKTGEANHLPMEGGTRHDNKKAGFEAYSAGGHEYSVLGARQDETNGKIYIKLRNPWGDTKGNYRALTGNGLVTSYKENGTKVYEWKAVPDGIFEMELSDFEHDFERFSINGFDKIEPITEFDSLRSIEFPSSEDIFKNKNRLTDFFFKICSRQLSEDNTIDNRYRPGELGINRLTAYDRNEQRIGKLPSNEQVGIFEKYEEIIKDFTKAIDESLDAYLLKMEGESPKDIALGLKNVIHKTFVTFDNKWMNDKEKGDFYIEYGSFPMVLCETVEEYLENLEPYMEKNDFINTKVEDKFKEFKEFLDSNPRHRITLPSSKFLNEDDKHKFEIKELYRNKDGHPMAKVINKNYEVEEMTFNELLEKHQRGRMIDGLNHTVERAPEEPKEYDRLKDNITDHKTYMSYLEEIDKAYKALKETDNYFSHDSEEYKELKTALKSARTTIAKLNGKSFDLLKDTLNNLGESMAKYDYHCQDVKKSGPRREKRVEILNNLKNIMVNANDKKLDAKNVNENAINYIDYSEASKCVRAERNITNLQKSIMKDINKSIDKKENRHMLSNLSKLLYLNDIRNNIKTLGEDTVNGCIKEETINSAIEKLNPVVKSTLKNKEIIIDSSTTGKELGEKLGKIFKDRVNDSLNLPNKNKEEVKEQKEILIDIK